MGSNQFAEKLVEVMLSWMRLVVNWFWAVFRTGAPSGLSKWFAGSWKGIVVTLILVGVVVDWLVWMIRWRPYWLWFRKKQIIYEDEEKPRREKVERIERPRDVERFHGSRSARDDDFEDPFAEPAKRPAQPARFTGWDSASDPYAPPKASEPKKQRPDKYADWEGGEDPYAPKKPQKAANKYADWDNSDDPYAR